MKTTIRSILSNLLTFSALVLTSADLIAQPQQLEFETEQFELGEAASTIFDLSTDSSDPMQIGYGRLRPNADTGFVNPAGAAFISFESDNVLLFESLVNTRRGSSGRIYYETSDSQTIGSLINTSFFDQALVTYYTTDSSGVESELGAAVIGPGEQLVAYLGQAPFATDSIEGEGTFTYSATVNIAASAFRERTIEPGAPGSLLTSIPIYHSIFSQFGTVHLPIFIADFEGADHEGTAIGSSVVLVNITDEPMSGSVFIDVSDGQTAPLGDYEIPAKSAVSSDLAEGNFFGTVRIVPETDTAAPNGFVLMSYFNDSSMVTRTSTEVAIPGISPGTDFSFFVEGVDPSENDETLSYSFYISNKSSNATEVNVELRALDGTLLLPAETLELAESNGIQFLLGDQFDLPADFAGGVVKVSAGDNIVVAGLRGRTNSLGDHKISQVPVASASEEFINTQYFPLLIASEGFSTDVYFYNHLPGLEGTYEFDAFSQAGTQAGFDLVQRIPAVSSNDILAGEFSTLSADGVSIVVADMTFDGSGSGAASNIIDYEGSEVTPSSNSAITYAANQSRRLSLTLSPGSDQQTFTGIVGSSGEQVLLVSSDSEPTVMLLTQLGVGLSTSTLNGEYVAGSGLSDTNSLLLFNFDGAGAGSFQVTDDLLEGDSASSEMIPFIYSIAPNGGLSVTVDEGGDVQTFTGSVTAEGTSFSLGATTDPANRFILGHLLGTQHSQSSVTGRYVAGALLGTTTSGFALDFDGNGSGSIVAEDLEGNTIASIYNFQYDVATNGEISLTVDLEAEGQLLLRGSLREDLSQLVLVAAEGNQPIMVIGLKAP